MTIKGVTMSTPERLSDALTQWRNLLGAAHLLCDPSSLERYARCTEPTGAAPAAVLLPESVEALVSAVKIAAACSVPLYPVSRGKNWGYGSTSPAQEGSVLVDLSRMNRILEVNAKLGYAVVEPGVSQRDLYDHLVKNRIPLSMDVTGAPSDSSLLGNILERGYGQTPYSDHFLHSCGMEVVLADGTIVRTGFGHYAQAKTAHLHKWGVGPYLDGLFTQSNFGIVTKIGIWLMPEPADFGVFSFKMSDDEPFAMALERVRELKMRDVLTSAVHFFNDVRVLSSLRQFPWKESAGTTPLSDELAERLRRDWRVGTWNCGGGLRGSTAQIRVTLAEVRKALKGLARVEFISQRKVGLLSRLRPAVKSRNMDLLSRKLPFFGLMRGIPTDDPTLIAYWRKRTAAPQTPYDPPRDKCGLIWCAPVIPLLKEDALETVRLTRSVCRQHGFEANISMNLITARSISCVIGILYDKEDGRETRKAAACYEELLKRFCALGYLPYRVAHPFPKELLQPEDPFWNVCRSIKKALDPKGIISPGRYGLR
ncbi:MAG: FAD-binding oxidoreductase [Candidatus Omnitrophica bacterium]|nr:FAD-binding oxidoreductase [Candidatus Omnitrophota bacterium]